MKKYIIGGLFGFLLAFGTTGYAADVVNLIGKSVEGMFVVQIDGKKLDKEALVVDGTTYLPVREFGEAIGYDVTFDPDLGVTMKKKVDTERQSQLEKAKKEREAKEKETKIQMLKTDIEAKQMYLDSLEYELKTIKDETLISKQNEQISKLKKEIADLQSQLAQ